jgi:hypothetical protein
MLEFKPPYRFVVSEGSDDGWGDLLDADDKVVLRDIFPDEAVSLAIRLSIELTCSYAAVRGAFKGSKPFNSETVPSGTYVFWTQPESKIAKRHLRFLDAT